MGIEHMKYLKIIFIVNILWFAISCGQQKQYLNYKVKEGETIKSIAKRLDMDTKELLRLNPEVSRRPDANTVIIIPNSKQVALLKKQKNNTTAITFNKSVNDSITRAEKIAIRKAFVKDSLLENYQKNYIVHEVKKGDTFYSLVRKYNVSQKELINLNPILEEGLKTDQIIKVKFLDDVFEEDNFLYKDTIAENISLDIAMLLPFNGKELDTLEHTEIFSRSRLANIVTDFYFGAEIAIDSIRKQGIDVNVNVFDTGKNSSIIDSIIMVNDFNKKDAIIGPFYSEEVNLLAANVKAPIVYPVYSQKQATFTSKRIVKTAPNKSLYRKKLLEYITDNFFEGNIIIVGDGRPASDFNTLQIQKTLEKHDSISNVSVILPEEGYIDKEKFTELLLPNEKNYVVMTADDNVIVASAINGLISLPDFVSVRVFTFDKVSAFNKVDNFKLAQIEFTYVSDEFSNEGSEKIQLFNQKYFSRNNTLPSSYSMKGFDITYDVLIRLASGKSLKATFDEGFSYRLESKFDYTDKIFKVTENKGLFIVKYNPDLTLTRLK
jgi:LysM repeat protein